MSDAKHDEPVMTLDADDAGAAIIRLVSKDGKEFPIEKTFAFVSNLVKTSLEDDSSTTEIPMLGVKADVLDTVVQFMQHHRGVEPPLLEKPLRSKVMKEMCKDSWDADFIDRVGENRQLLYDVILAANYMDVKSLLHLGCAKVASLIKGQPLERMKDILSKGTKGDAAAVK